MKYAFSIKSLPVGLTLGLVFVVLWHCWALYGPNGWRDQVLVLAGSRATRDALDDYSTGVLKLYILEEDRYLEPKSLNTNQGSFEMWTIGYVGSAGGANRYFVEQYVRYYNMKMRYMNAHPDKCSGVLRQNRNP